MRREYRNPGAVEPRVRSSGRRVDGTVFPFRDFVRKMYIPTFDDFATSCSSRHSVLQISSSGVVRGAPLLRSALTCHRVEVAWARGGGGDACRLALQGCSVARRPGSSAWCAWVVDAGVYAQARREKLIGPFSFINTSIFDKVQLLYAELAVATHLARLKVKLRRWRRDFDVSTSSLRTTNRPLTSARRTSLNQVV